MPNLRDSVALANIPFAASMVTNRMFRQGIADFVLDYSAVAKEAYKIADAVIEARGEQPPEYKELLKECLYVLDASDPHPVVGARYSVLCSELSALLNEEENA